MQTQFLPLNNGNRVHPGMIKGIRLIPGRGVVLVNEYSKIIDLIESDADDWSRLMADVIAAIVQGPKRFTPPDWVAIRREYDAGRLGAVPA